MRKYVMLVMIIWLTPCIANTLDQAIEEANAVNEKATVNPIQAINAFEPSQTFDHFSANPKQAEYYNKGSKHDSLKPLVQSEAVQTEAFQTINSSVNQHPKITVNSEEQGMQKAALIEDNAESIVKGVSNQFIDCQSMRTCQVEYKQATCLEGGGFGQQRCTKDLQIDAEPAINQQHIYFIDLQTQGQGLLHKEAQVTLDMKRATLITPANQQAQITITPAFVIPPCQGLTVTFMGAQSLNQSVKTQVKLLALPNCANHFKLTVKLESDSWRARMLSSRLQLKFVSIQPEVIKEQWVENCTALEKRGCVLVKPAVCSKPQATRIINNVPITRECWQQTALYDCGQTTESDQTCTNLRTRNCEQVGSVCLQKNTAGFCTLYQQSFRCPINTCKGAYGMTCNGQTYCLEGDCVKGKNHPSQDFAKSVSAFSAVQEAGSQFSSDTVTLFRGQAESCGNDSVNFNNCCRDEGWGQDLHLAQCSQSEKTLGLHKEAGLSVYIGEYCAKSVLGACLSHRKMYCTFPSKLARIVQEQGRLGQLKVDFGHGKHPNCRGITPEELQQIDFSKIDFQPYYEELQNKVQLPAQESITAQVHAKTQQLYQEKQLP